MWYVSYFAVRAIGVCGVFSRYSLPSERCRHACIQPRKDGQTLDALQADRRS